MRYFCWNIYPQGIIYYQNLIDSSYFILEPSIPAVIYVKNFEIVLQLYISSSGNVLRLSRYYIKNIAIEIVVKKNFGLSTTSVSLYTFRKEN